ncbi:hypothetical protein ACC792_37775, partial [Rhizobium ruizarguesonis]
VTRLADGRISRVTFTCDGPEYWQFLAATDPAKVLDQVHGTLRRPAVQLVSRIISSGRGQKIIRLNRRVYVAKVKVQNFS